MNTRIDDDRFQKLKSNKIEQIKSSSTKQFKYWSYWFFFLSNIFFSLTFFSHKTYRLIIKKLRRQIVRQQHAKERDEQQRLEDIRQQNDPLHQAWIMQKEYLRQQRELDEERELYVNKNLIFGKLFFNFFAEKKVENYERKENN